MEPCEKVLIFTLAGLRCALPLGEIEKIHRAVEISPIPKAPANVLGLINIHGQIVPVLNIRRLLHLAEVDIDVNDHFILTRTRRRLVAIPVDNVLGLFEQVPSDVIAPDDLLLGTGFLHGVTRLEDDILFLYDLDKVLTSDDFAKISQCLHEIEQTSTHPETAKEEL